MATTSPLSGFLSLNLRDLTRSLLMVVLGALVTTLFEVGDMLATGEPLNIADVWLSFKVGALAGIANLVKQLFTNGTVVKDKVIKEEVAAEKEGPTEYNLIK